MTSPREQVYPSSRINVLGSDQKSRSRFGKSSTIVAASHLLKALIGPTLLVMPGAFKNGGLVFSVFAYVALVMLISYNMKRMVDCADHLSQREQLDVLTYDQVVFISFSTCSRKTQRFARALRLTVNILFVITYLDAICIFVIFIARNADSIYSYYASFPDQRFNVRHFIFFQMILIMIMNTVRQLKYLSPFSIIASILLGVVAVICFHLFLRDGVDDVWARRQIGDYSIIRFAATVLFSISGISITLTIKSSMRKPRYFLTVYCITLTLTCCLYVPFGYLGYLKYGEATESSIMLNFANDEAEFIVVKALTVIAVGLTIPIAFYVMFNVLWNNYLSIRISESNQLLVEYFYRAALIIVVFGLAMAFPALGAMIVLKGALLHSQLEMIYPPIVEFVTFYPEKGNGRGYCRLIKVTAISLLGIFICVGGTALGIYDLVIELYQT